uniref:Ig-like domain-containing protein n=1 Tax=Poecilia formosa TaxID=48698 RepID=A0A087Y513_POEFO
MMPHQGSSLTSDLCVVSSTAGQTIRAEPGENAILPCEAPEKKPVIIVEWRRCDLEGNDHVALYQDDQFDDEGQNPAYKNRVDLQDREIKNGDVSLVLKNVTTDDTGTYECRVNQTEVRRRKRSHLKNEPIICIINLVVSAPAKDGGTNTGLTVGLPVGLLVLALFAVSGFLLCKKLRRSPQEQNQ